ncbi:restriction endonuclease subunit S [Desulfovibrio litoralis]|uniref:Type I restriction enzyme, S subunit n=1 Tax=Desulfovibrio litoralis DSM 11393 TaxID=1121455 RepID=A0A1M7SZL6_9BACT|nr:restriction endonuclease subunit S [Desulfovibrio litoralis]SHN63864.1 type I restriction enzyme, S subunit [Desulfovibrio litoralis DSM 11393]
MLKPYDEYKKTGVKWIENIPKFWNFNKIGILFIERKTKVSDKDYPPLSVTKNGIVPQLASAAKSDDGDNRKLVYKSDFVINSRSDRKGSSGVSPLDGSVSLINLVLKPRKSENGDFLHYLLKHYDFIEEYYRNGRGIVADLWTTRYSEMKNICLPIPPRQEQDQIVRYLDWQVSKINKLIKAKKKQISLLNEQKQAIINKAVTKGLDDAVPMKDSGVEWIGEIPESWEKTKLKRLGKFKSGTNLTSLDIDNTGKFAVYGGNGIRGYYNTYNNKGECVLFGRQGALCGNAHYVNGEFWATEHAVVFKPNSYVFGKWAYFLIIVMNLNQYSESAAQPGLSVEKVININTILPTFEEQHSILNFIESKLTYIEKLITKFETEINLINEYKTSLISSVVTGKVDVRNIIVPEFEPEELLEEVEEESLEEPEQMGEE